MFKARASSERLACLEEAVQGLDDRLESLQAILEGIEAQTTENVRAQLEELVSSEYSPLLEAFAELEQAVGNRLEEITVAVARGIEHVDRAENRIKSTVGRARSELRKHGLESPGLEAEYRGLQVIDGDGGDEEGLPPMPENVARARPDTSGIPGLVTDQDLEQLGA